MNKLLRKSYYVYLIIAIILIFEGVLQLIDNNRQMAAIILCIAILVIFKFFFTRKFRRKIEEKNQKQ